MIEGFFYCDVVISTKVAGSVEVLDEKFLFDFGRVKEKIEDVYKNYNEYKKDFESAFKTQVSSFGGHAYDGLFAIVEAT